MYIYFTSLEKNQTVPCLPPIHISCYDTTHHNHCIYLPITNEMLTILYAHQVGS